MKRVIEFVTMTRKKQGKTGTHAPRTSLDENGNVITWITSQDTMKRLQISRGALTLWMKRGAVKAVTFGDGRNLWFNESEINTLAAPKPHIPKN